MFLFWEKAAALLKGRQRDRRNCKKFGRPVMSGGEGTLSRDKAEEAERGLSMTRFRRLIKSLK